MKLLNLFYASFMIASTSLVGLVSKNSTINNYQGTFTMDVSDFKSEGSMDLEAAIPNTPVLYPGDIARFSKGFSFGFENFTLPKNVNPTEFTKVNRTDDASVRVAFKRKNIIEENLVKIASFDPFSVINFKNMHKYNSMDFARSEEEVNKKAKENSAGISQQITMENWYVDEGVKKIALRIKFITYVSLYWIQTSGNNGFLGATMLIEVDFIPFLAFDVSKLYSFDFNVVLGNVVKFS